MPESAPLPPALDDRWQWMAHKHGEKTPFAPWADEDHPEAEPEKDARYKWGLAENYTDSETVAEWVEKDPRLAGRVFIQRESDPLLFVDGDDVRDPDTGAVHPGFVALLNHLGVTYADVSTSGSGVHAYDTGEIPIDGKGQAAFEIDREPWGANDAAPTVEIYATKHVCVTTGEHVPGTPLSVSDVNADALRSVLLANGYSDEEPVTHNSDRDRAELEEYEPTATNRDERTEHVRDVLAAVDRLDPRDVRLATTETGSDATG